MPDFHGGFTLWFTGLPCSGKTSISDLVGKELRLQGHCVEYLDGDIIRKGLSRDLGFSREDRDSNVKRVTFVASLLTRNGVATLVSLVSPYRRARDESRAAIRAFIEVYVRCPLDVCEKRDSKGMFQKARTGKLPFFTGVSDPYEEPLNPEIILNTDTANITTCVSKVLDYLDSKKLLFRHT